MGEDDLRVLAGFEGEEADAARQLVQDVFLDDAVDELVHLLGATFDFCMLSSLRQPHAGCSWVAVGIALGLLLTWCALDDEFHLSHVLGYFFLDLCIPMFSLKSRPAVSLCHCQAYPRADHWLP